MCFSCDYIYCFHLSTVTLSRLKTDKSGQGLVCTSICTFTCTLNAPKADKSPKNAQNGIGHHGRDLYERQAPPPRRKSQALQLQSRLYPRSLDSSSGASSRAGTETTTVGGGAGIMDSSWRTTSTELSGESRINSALSNNHNGRAAHAESSVPRLPSIAGVRHKNGGGGRSGGQDSPGLDRVKRHLARVEDGRNAEDGIYVIGVSD